jgi:hypothetical protein
MTKIPRPAILNEAYKRVFMNMYVANVRNRLRELTTPSPSDIRRWVYELVQNAKDSICDDPTRTDVDIQITTTDKTVEFKHNGSPFTAEALFGLLYKYSEGKRIGESTGRFGTGFLTTHCLSKIVSVSGDMYTDDKKSSVVGFSATMYRNGTLKDELQKGVIAMEESLEFYAERKIWTTFTYHLELEQRTTAKVEGVRSLLHNALPMMLFCPVIKTLELFDEGKLTRFVRLPPKVIKGNLMSTEFLIEKDETVKHKFIHISSNRQEEA